MNIEFINSILNESDFDNFINFEFFTINKNFNGLDDFLEKITIYNFDENKIIILQKIFLEKGESFSLENSFLEFLTEDIEKCFDFIDLDGDKNKIVLKSQEGLKKHVKEYNSILRLIEKGINKKRNEEVKEQEELELLNLEKELNLVY